MEGQIDIFEVLKRETSSVSPSGCHLPHPGKAGEATRAPIRPLTLDQVRGLEPFRSTVWIENRDFGKGGFLELFQADVSLIGRSIYTNRDVFHFSYTYTNGRRYDHSRVDEFYGREWRVWPDRPTDEERSETPWKE